MTRAEAIERIRAFKNYLCSGNPIWDVNEVADAFDRAIKDMETCERNAKSGEEVITHD